MHIICTIALGISISILILLWKEERRFRKNITHGLASKFWILRERRKYIRFKDDIKIRYDITRKPSDPVRAGTTDISQKGLCLLTYRRLKENDYLNLEIELPDFSKPVRLTGQVVWTRDVKDPDAQNRRLFNAGIRFSKIRPEYEAILLTHLNKYKRD